MVPEVTPIADVVDFGLPTPGQNGATGVVFMQVHGGVEGQT